MKPENKATDTAVPSVDELTGELNRVKYHSLYKKLLRSTIYTLVNVAAISVLVATLLLPVLQIFGTSMNPNLQEGEIVVSVKSPQFKTGDIIAFYYNNRSCQAHYRLPRQQRCHHRQRRRICEQYPAG